MPNGRFFVDEKAFEELTLRSQIAIFYKTYNLDREEDMKRNEEQDARIKKLENRKRVDRVYSGIGGVGGGFFFWALLWLKSLLNKT